MSKIHYLQGDATQPKAVGRQNKFIAHICNDAGKWGKGFVMAVSDRWPQLKTAYLRWHALGEAADFCLGKAQFIKVADDLWVANMLAQHGVKPEGDTPPIRYEALRLCLAEVARTARSVDGDIHMPRIGTGLAGGNWADIEPIIQDTLCSRGADVYVYDLDPPKEGE